MRWISHWLEYPFKNVRKEQEVRDDWQNETSGWSLGSHLRMDMITYSGSVATHTVS